MTLGVRIPLLSQNGLGSRWGSVKALSLKEVSGQTERFDSFTTHKILFFECRYGGIGRHASLRGWCRITVGVGVRVPLSIQKADVAELVDARDLKSRSRMGVWVRVPPSVLFFEIRSS